MPRRSLLSAEQRARLFAIPTTPAEMATHYVLSPEDRLLVRSKRRSTNRLGFQGLRMKSRSGLARSFAATRPGA